MESARAPRTAEMARRHAIRCGALMAAGRGSAVYVPGTSGGGFSWWRIPRSWAHPMANTRPTSPPPAPAAARPPRTPVPLALWPLAPIGPVPDRDDALADVGLPDGLARRIVAEYARPGDPLLGLALTGTTVELAVATPARLVAVDHASRGRTGEHSAPPDSSDCARDHARGRPRRAEVPAADISRLPRLHPDLMGTTSLAVFAPAGCPPADGRPDGRIASPGQPTRPATPDREQAVTAVPAALDAAWQVLRPGGLLVTVTTSSRRGRVFRDAAGQMVRLARAAGFGYTQHVIALRVPIDHDRLAPSLSSADQTHFRGRRARAGQHQQLPVHQDVCVFTKPPQAEPPDADAGVAAPASSSGLEVAG